LPERKLDESLPWAGRPMSILIDQGTRLVVQGITGREGTFHTLRDRTYGTNVVAGVTPGKAGESVEGIPVFDTVAEAVQETDANTSLIFVPARFAGDAILEAAGGGVAIIVCITEGIPVKDMANVVAYLEGKDHVLIGPNCPGLISPGKANVGIIPGEICARGPVGLISRSGTLTYQIVHELTGKGIGQSTCVGMGGDPVHGIGFVEALQRFEEDAETEAVVLIGEIGGSDEEIAAGYISDHVSKPVVAYVAGFSAPPGKRMGHAGAIITGTSGTAQAKADAFEAVGVRVGRNPTEVAELVQRVVSPT
jgi:succinyl-CoA synthetase alpha subunit